MYYTPLLPRVLQGMQVSLPRVMQRYPCKRPSPVSRDSLNTSCHHSAVAGSILQAGFLPHCLSLPLPPLLSFLILSSSFSFFFLLNLVPVFLKIMFHIKTQILGFCKNSEDLATVTRVSLSLVTQQLTPSEQDDL